jgi:sulfite reductase alpha subunit
MKRQGFQKLLDATGLKAIAQQVEEPRHNPYIFWRKEEVPGEWPANAGDLQDFRTRHQR